MPVRPGLPGAEANSMSYLALELVRRMSTPSLVGIAESLITTPEELTLFASIFEELRKR